AVPLGAIILTKMDGAARGGGALAAVAKTGARIAFIGVGEDVDELEPFDPPSFVSRLLGMGDLKALVERMSKVELRSRPDALLRGKFTLLEFKQQLEELSKLGPLRKILELVPGAPQLTPELERTGSENIRKWLAIMSSMTLEELTRPEIIDKSRMLRIARGSGTTVRDVRELLTVYRRTRKLLKRLGRSRRGLSALRLG
ncbi:MAG: signal recognition particle protein Srp19, partial [Thermoprotei archaeon]